MERNRTRSIQGFIVEHVDDDPRGIARRVAQAYGISRQAANRHLDALVGAGVLDQAGQTRAREYTLRRMSVVSRELRVTPVLSAARVWDEHVAPVLAGDRAVVREVGRAIFDELVENAIVHAGAAWISVELAATARQIDLEVGDDGRGIFAAWGEKSGAATPREAAMEFALRANDRSVDPPTTLVALARRTESFALASAGVACAFDAGENAWRVLDAEGVAAGTRASCRLRRVASRARADEALMRPRS